MSKFVNIITGEKADTLPNVIGATINAQNDFDLCAKHGWRVFEEQKAPEGTVATKTMLEDVDGKTARLVVVATITTAEVAAKQEQDAETYRLAAEKAKADFEKWDKDTSHWTKHERLLLAIAKPKEMSAEDWQKRFDEEWAKLEG